MTQNRTRNCVVLVLLLVIETMGFALIAPVFTPLLLKSHILLNTNDIWTRVLILGLFNAVYPFCMFIATPFLGRLSDKWGRKKVFLLSLIGTACGYLLVAIGIWSHLLILALIGRALDGLTAGSIPVAQATMADMSASIQNKVRLMGLTVLGFSGGQVLGPMISGVLSDTSISHWFGFAFPFYVVTVLSLVNIGWLCWGFKETHVVKQAQKLARPVITKAFFILIVALLCNQMAVSLFMQSMPAILTEDFNFTGLQLGYYGSLAGVVMAISVAFILPFLMRRVNNVKHLLIPFFCCQALAILIMALVHDDWAAWFTVILIIFGTSQSYACFLTLYSNSGDNKNQGWFLGASASIVALSWAITAVLSGVLPLEGGLIVPVWTAFGLSVFGVILVLGFKQPSPCGKS